MASFTWPVANVNATNPSVGTNGTAIPLSSTLVGGSDGANIQPVKTDSSGVVQTNVTGSALPTGAATAAKQDTGNTSLASIDTKTPALVTGRVPVDGSGVTQPISAASLPLPTGAATAAKQPALGTAGTASSDVITIQGIASMTAVKVDGSAVTQPISAASLPLPTNAATSALQTTGNTSLSSIDGKLGSLGQKAMAGSAPVVIASDQSAIPASQSGTWTVQPGNTANTTAWLVNNQVIGQSGSTNANSSVASVALEASHVIKASAGRLFQLSGVNTKGSAQYIQVHNTTSVPADTAVPVLLLYVPANTNFSFDFGNIGRYFATGITVCNSSTAATKTIGSSDCWFNAEYL